MNFKPILIGEEFRNWMECFSEKQLSTLLHVMNNFDKINFFFMNNYQNKNGALREAHVQWRNVKDQNKIKIWDDS